MKHFQLILRFFSYGMEETYFVACVIPTEIATNNKRIDVIEFITSYVMIEFKNELEI